VGAWVRCPLCREEYSLREAIYALPPVLEIIASPVTTTPLCAAPLPVVAAKVRPPKLPPLAASFQTDAKQEVIDEPPQETPRPNASFTRPLVQADAPVSPLPSRTPGVPTYARDPVRPPALPNSDPPQRAASAPSNTTSSPMQAAAPSEVVASADEPWMSEVIGGHLSDRTRRRRRSSPLREFLKIAIGGLAGLLLGNAVLFWGFKVDLFNMAKHLPAFMVPEQLMPKDESTTGIKSGSEPRLAAGQWFHFPHGSI
jgi:hypothetical protein